MLKLVDLVHVCFYFFIYFQVLLLSPLWLNSPEVPLLQFLRWVLWRRKTHLFFVGKAESDWSHCLARAKIIMEGRELLVFFPSDVHVGFALWCSNTTTGLLHIDEKKRRKLKKKNPSAFRLSHYVPNCCSLSLLMPTRPSRSCEDNLSLQRCSNMADGANYQGSHARASRSVINPPPPPNTQTQDIVTWQHHLLQLPIDFSKKKKKNNNKKKSPDVGVLVWLQLKLNCWQLCSPSSPVKSDCSPNHSVAKASGYTSKDTVIEFCPSIFFSATPPSCVIVHARTHARAQCEGVF